jgi:hypothetical protein
MHAAFRVGGRAAIDKVMKNQPAIFLKPIRHLRGLAGGMRLRRAGIFCPFSGKRWPTWQCAGCDAPIGGSQALNLPDGNRVHFEPIDCLIRFGERWRGDASAALIALGLEPPRLDGGQL